MDKKKFSTGETVFVGLILATVDLAEFIATFASPIPGFGQVLAIGVSVVGVCVILLFYLFLYMKGVKNVWTLVGGFLDAVPLLNSIPTKTIMWGIVVFLNNNPKGEKLMKLADIKKPSIKNRGNSSNLV